jgi:hypothetical protein
MGASVHDNTPVSYEVECEARQIVLRTEFRDVEPMERIRSGRPHASSRPTVSFGGLDIADVTVSRPYLARPIERIPAR